VQIQTATRYTLSASGISSASAKVLLAKELLPIRNPDAPTQCEICGLGARKFPFAIAVLRAKTPDDIRALISKRNENWLYHEYKDMSIAEIQFEFERLIRKGRSLDTL
jgi:hypothetical protein